MRDRASPPMHMYLHAWFPLTPHQCIDMWEDTCLVGRAMLATHQRYHQQFHISWGLPFNRVDLSIFFDPFISLCLSKPNTRYINVCSCDDMRGYLLSRGIIISGSMYGIGCRLNRTWKPNCQWTTHKWKLMKPRFLLCKEEVKETACVPSRFAFYQKDVCRYFDVSDFHHRVMKFIIRAGFCISKPLTACQ